jgi:alanine dehydrogenase
VNCSVLPTTIVFLFAGVAKYAWANVATGFGAAVTVIPQGEAVRLPTWAHMFVVPAPTAVAMPLLLIEAACGALLVQAVTELPLASGSIATDPSE